ncbi:putative LPS assembly protein LptD [Anditalea andensis]|uniref:Organic solvent tolerance protein OstA n=1 Tax=Anditalea andensis TaxID=1048983 RepID=A0A074L4P5_9BACT|nr:putative LPS assembly protein LptD [Anditalea andensis]KEO74833.1 Organic solvent tolerance protein OstA [Anditalea andensis]
MQIIRLVFLSLTLFFLLDTDTFGQRRGQRPPEQRVTAPDTVINPNLLRQPAWPDSIPIPAPDTIPPTADTSNVVPKGDIQTTINYFAEDSIVSDFTQNKVFLYNDAWFEYGNIRLDADYIVIDWEKSELFASGIVDSLGAIQGNPIFKEGPSTYEIRKEMRYNFRTQKAIITDVVTEQDEGFLRGQTVKKDDDGSVYLANGFYTTCDLAEPHWHISAGKIKSVRGKHVITGPFNLYFNNIPTPLGLPFGFLPDKQEKASGILFPSYGEEQIRGFFLRDFGYYFAFNDYIHTRVTGEVFSKGGYGTKIGTLYRKRYRYSGGFNLDYQRFQSPETEQTQVDYNEFWVRWQHTPESRGTSRFSASVNAGTTTYNNAVVNPVNFARNINAEFTSNVSYSKTFQGTPFSMSANLRHSQNIQTDQVRLVLPDIAVNMNRQNPFRNVNWEPLKTLNIAWNFNAQNSIDNAITSPLGVQNQFLQDEFNPQAPNVLPFTFANLPQLLREADNGFRHTVPISSNFTLFRYFTGTAAFNYTELWYLNRIDYFYNEERGQVDQIRSDGFNRAGFYNSSFNLSTNIYGFYTFRKGGRIEAIRHHVQPTIGFSYSPDFSDPRFGFYQQVQSDARGNRQFYSRYQGFIFGGAPLGESRAMNISVRNVVEAKVRGRDRDDGETPETKKIPLLQTLNIATNYNFAADSFNLAPINFNTRTSFFEQKLSIFISTTLDPYAEVTYTNTQEQVMRRRVNNFAWNNGQGIGTIRNATLNINGSINPSRTERSPGEVRDDLTNDFMAQGGQMNEFVQNEIDRIVADPSRYIDWDIPWNLTFGYNLNYNKSQNTGVTNVSQAMNVSGDVSFSEKWKINFNTGYDVSSGQITQSMIGIARDLHCWQMNVNWIPFGRFTSYNIDIRVKSSILQDLKVSRRRSFFDAFR